THLNSIKFSRLLPIDETLTRGIIYLPHQKGGGKMIACERSTARDAGLRFAEWASLFSEKCFVMIVVYADETGTQGLKPDGKEPAPGVYGFVATRKRWQKFCEVWTSALGKYKVSYFHFRELHPSE